MTAAKTRGRKYIRNRGYGNASGTSSQASVQAIFKQLSQAWQGLTNAQILAWNSAALSGVDAPASATLALSDEAFTLTLASIPTVTTNIKLVICASEPQSNGISKVYAKAAEIGGPETPSTTAVDIQDDYEAKYGAVSAGNPKVFFKYFFVNTATGEKSCEMLAVAKFTASESNED